MVVAGWVILHALGPMGMAQQLPIPGMPGKPLSEVSGPDSGMQAPPTAPGPVDPAAGGVEEGTLSTRRDPFWPVGYVPRKPDKLAVSSPTGPEAVKAVEPEPMPLEWDQARAQLDLRGVSNVGRDKTTGKPRFVAVMGGKLLEEGNTVSIAYGGQVYRWKVVTVDAAGVQLVKLDVRAE
jgi:hypothetical protein